MVYLQDPLYCFLVEYEVVQPRGKYDKKDRKEGKEKEEEDKLLPTCQHMTQRQLSPA